MNSQAQVPGAFSTDGQTDAHEQPRPGDPNPLLRSAAHRLCGAVQRVREVRCPTGRQLGCLRGPGLPALSRASVCSLQETTQSATSHSVFLSVHTPTCALPSQQPANVLINNPESDAPIVKLGVSGCGGAHLLKLDAGACGRPRIALEAQEAACVAPMGVVLRVLCREGKGRG